MQEREIRVEYQIKKSLTIIGKKSLGEKKMKKRGKKLKSPIDSIIIDLILEHYNIKTLKGVRETLTADEFMEIVDIAEEQYYQRSITNSTIGMA